MSYLQLTNVNRNSAAHRVLQGYITVYGKYHCFNYKFQYSSTMSRAGSLSIKGFGLAMKHFFLSNESKIVNFFYTSYISTEIIS